MNISIVATKSHSFPQSRRALAAQREARAKEVLAQTKSMQSTMTVGRKHFRFHPFNFLNSADS